ncbi:MAG TPA: hypothetical protein VFO83_12480, partial [Aggregicoccus sp.]|nr:hypothetical protein [Aggregicoccus sp.]
AGLVLTGSASPAGHRRALWQLFEGSLGRVALEDRVKVGPAAPAPREVEAPDAGAPAFIEVLPPGTTDPAPRRRKRATPPSG